MEAAQTIRHAVAQVTQLRQDALADPALAAAIAAVKRLQSRRFEGTYADLLAQGPYQAATAFFLNELYNDRDHAERDAQFARIAGALQKLFPRQAVATAVSLAQLHAMTEQLDHAMGQSWLACGNAGDTTEAGRYIASWRDVARRADREAQLSVVMDIGHELERLTRMPGLHTMLRMMRGPAAAAGLSSLQAFLETGFDTFAALARHRGGVAPFLDLIQGRESVLIERLFDAPLVTCETELGHTLGQAR